jgi:hypothetical protein
MHGGKMKLRKVWFRLWLVWGAAAMTAACGQAASTTAGNAGSTSTSTPPPSQTASGQLAPTPVPTPTRISLLAKLQAAGGASHLSVTGVPVGAICTAQLAAQVEVTPPASRPATTPSSVATTVAFPRLTDPPVKPSSPGAATGTASFDLPSNLEPPSGPFTWTYDCREYDRVQTRFLVGEQSGSLSGHG